MIRQKDGLTDPEQLGRSIQRRERSAVATALNLLDDKRLEGRRRATQLLRFLADSALTSPAHLIGLTGPPGVGKSSLTSSLINVWRRRGRSVGILAVDPSSPISGGALLGDRLRMMSAFDPSVFVRSLASRDDFGGLSAEVWPMAQVMMAAFDIVLIETVGVGQREVDVSRLSDTTCYVAQPGSGDSIQFLKAGIMEVPHVLVVNKADMGAPARRTLSDLETTIGGRVDEDGWTVAALAVSAAKGDGIEALVDRLEQHRRTLVWHKRLAARRRGFQADWIAKRLRQEFGSFGIDRLGGDDALKALLKEEAGAPFHYYEELRQQLIGTTESGGRATAQ